MSARNHLLNTSALHSARTGLGRGASLGALAISLLTMSAPAWAQGTPDAASAPADCSGLAGAALTECEARAAQPPVETATGAAQPEAQAGEPEAIVITGSRIPRANFDTPQPAVVLGGAQIEQRGYSNLADALEELPAFGVPGSSPVGAGQSGDVGSGQNFVNFFGLGDQRTLTLVNGRRFVSSNTASIFGPTGTNGSQVDFNVLPTLLIDRVETVAVGGAPIYGADAIAGTINVITKRTFKGVQLDAQNAISSRGDLQDWRIRGAAGTSFADGRGNISVAAEYNKAGGLDFEDRKNMNNFYTTPADPSSPFQNVLIRDRRLPSLSEFGLPQISDQFIVLDPDTAAAFGGFQVGVTDDGQASGNPLVFNDLGQLVPIDFGTATGNLINYDGGNGFVLPGNLVAPLRRVVGTVLAQYELTDTIRVFGEGWYANSKGTTFRAQPEYNTFLFAGAGEPAGQFILSLDNPFLSASARTLIQNAIANNPNSDQNAGGAPQDYFYLTRANTDIISGKASSTVELYRFVGGLDGKFNVMDREFRFEVVGNYGKSTTKGNGRAVVQQNLENALDAVVDANGNIVCRPGYVNADVPTFSSTCSPLNPFGRQVSPEAAAYITAPTNPKNVNDQKVFTASVSGSLFDIWGGPVSFALGYEHREESSKFSPGTFYSGGPDPDPTVDENGDGDPTNDRVPFGQSALYDPVSGKFNTDEFFGELTVPLVSRDQNIPGIYSLELNGAIRLINHSLAGSDPTYTLGATWQPIRDITLRGNYTRSVRSPAITEYFNPTSQIFTTANDPCDDQFISSGPNPATRAANCAADGIQPGFSSDIVDFTATGSLSGNANLINETADAWTIGTVLRPRFLPGFTASVDWIDIKLKNAVTALTATQVLEACYDSPDFPGSVSASGTNFCEQFTRDADGQITFIETGFENAAGQRFKGLISEIAYRRDTPFLGAESSLEFGLNYLYNDTLTVRVGRGDITTLASSIGYSRHQATGNLTYRNKGLALQWQTQFFGKAKIDPDAEENTYEFPTIERVFLHNLSATYNVDRFRFNVVVDNVFDRKKPFQVPASGGTVTYFDAIRGRYFRFGAGVRF